MGFPGQATRYNRGVDDVHRDDDRQGGADAQGVLLSAPGSPASQTRSSLVQTDDPLTAMVELCLLDRAYASREAWGLSRSTSLTLVLADGVELPEAMQRAITRHLPDCRIIREHESSAAPELQREQVAPPTPPDEDGDDEPGRLTPDEISMLLEDPPP